MPDDFASLLAWLRERVGEEVTVFMGGPFDGETNVGMRSKGALQQGGGEVSLIDPAPGEVITFSVGSANVVLLEGDLVNVEFEDGRSTTVGDSEIRLPASALADFGELTVVFSAGR